LDEIKARRAAGGQGAKIFAHRVVIASAAEFIAHSPDDIDWLIGEVARLTGERERFVARVTAAEDRLAGALGIGFVAFGWASTDAAITILADAAAERIATLTTDVASAELKAEHYHEEIVASHAERDRLAAELSVAVAALESGDACGAVGCRAVVERDRLAAQVRAVETVADKWRYKATWPLDDPQPKVAATPEPEGTFDTSGGREYLRQLLGHHPSPGIVAAVRRTLAEEGTTLEEVAAEFGIDLAEPEGEQQ
jgi:hypothetical protein